MIRYLLAIALLHLLSLTLADKANLEKPQPTDNTFHFNLLHTSDLHSHFDGAGPDNNPARGHFARLKYAIDTMQQMEPNTTLTVDAGDWFSGSLMHLISISKYYNEFGAIELKFLTDCKYDATTFGNHEFDPTERGIYHLLHKSQNKYHTPLPVVLSNVHYMDECVQFNNLTREGDAKYAPPGATITVDKSEAPSESPYITPFLLKELTDSRGKTLKVGIMGMFGPNAAQLSVAYRKCLLFDGFKQKRRNKLKWRQYVRKTIDVAKELREKHGAQVVIMLAHSGEPEDVRLMDALKKRSKNKPIVDIHISSHTHHIYLVNRAVGSGKTFVHQAGPFGTNLGVLQFEYDFKNGVISKLLNEDVPVQDYFYAPMFTPNTLFPVRIPITADMPMDKEYEQLINKYRAIVDESFLQKTGYNYATEIGLMPTDWNNKYELAQFVNDCLLNETNKKLLMDQYDPIHFFVVALGAVRTEVPALRAANVTGGPVTFQFSDAYRMLGIGFLSPEVSNDVLPGDPVSHFYIRKKEMYAFVTAARLLVQFAPVKDRYTLSFSSTLKYQEHKFGIPLVNNRIVGKVYDVQINDIDYDNLPDYIHIGMPGWLTRFFSRIGEMTGGLFNIYFRDREGRRLKDAMRTDLHDYMLFSKCVSSHTKHGDVEESASVAAESVKDIPEAAVATETSKTDEALAAGTPEANPADLEEGNAPLVEDLLP